LFLEDQQEAFRQVRQVEGSFEGVLFRVERIRWGLDEDIVEIFIDYLKESF
jgi:hypothetical protein